jgi:hypothetical protein
MPPHVPYGHHGPPPGCGWSVTDVWVWGANRAQLRCPDDVSDDIYECGVPGGALNLNSTIYPDHSRYWDLPLQGNIPTAEPGIEPGSSWLVVRSSDHQAKRLIAYLIKQVYTVKHNTSNINLLKTKRNLFYIRSQSVPRCKHFPSRL